jgi:hypothetical protein
MIGYVTLSMVLTTKTSMRSGTNFVMSMKSLSSKVIPAKDSFQRVNVSVVVECLWTKLDE